MAENKEKEQNITKKNLKTPKKSTKKTKTRKKKKKLTVNQARAKLKESRVKYQVTQFRKYIRGYIKISPLLSDLIQECAYMKVTLKDIKTSINENGVSYEYTNKAKETNIIKNPLLSDYKNMVKEYNAMIKILQESVKNHLEVVDIKSKEKEIPAADKDEFDDWVGKIK